MGRWAYAGAIVFAAGCGRISFDPTTRLDDAAISVDDGAIVVTGDSPPSWCGGGGIDTCLDPGFNVTLQPGDELFGYAISQPVAIDSVGRLLVGMYGLRAARVQPSGGALDPSFGTNGIAQIGITGEITTTLDVLPDDRVLLAGQTAMFDVVVGRMTTSGAPDPTFAGGSGVKRFTFCQQQCIANGVLIAGDGSMTFGGQRYANPTLHSIAFRLDASGAQIMTYGSGGLYESPTNTGGGDFLAHLPGTAGALLGSVQSLHRADANGMTMTSFGINGYAQPPLSLSEIVASGTDLILVGGANNIEIMKLTETGQIVTSFGTNGRLAVDFGLDERLNHAVVLPNGNIFAGGWRRESGNIATSQLFFVLVSPDGVLQGWWILDLAGTSDRVVGLVHAGAWIYVVAGSDNPGLRDHIVVMRLQAPL